MRHAIAVGKAVQRTSSFLGREGSTWPGHLALKADPKFVKKALNKNPGVRVVLIAGTNGKTTTTKALAHILEANGHAVLTNKTGANLLNGLASLLINHISLAGKLRHKVLIFEADENSLPIILQEIQQPDSIILLNLFRDQLDRYGEVNTVAEKWRKSVEKLDSKTILVANADDPLIANVALTAQKSSFFTIADKYKSERSLSHAVDSITCPKCNTTLTYRGISYSHLGNYTCKNCKFENPKAISFDIKTQLQGSFNLYNLASAILTAHKVFGIPYDDSVSSLETLKPAFGRQELIEIDNKKIMLLLSKNPTGFNESIKVALKNAPHSALLLLNDRVPDGRDISWIWDVDFELLRNTKNIYVSGDRAYDMANRLYFAGLKPEVFENYKNAYKNALLKTPKGQTLMVLTTYSAMLEIRKLISGKAIL